MTNNSYCVIDSNILIKVVLDEKDSFEAKECIRILFEAETTILVPSVFPYEIFHIAQKNSLDLKSIKEFLLSQSTIRYVELDNEIIDTSIDIIEKSSHPKSGYPSMYDSTYHAIAILNNCDFITADKRHYEKTKQLGNIKLLSDIKI